MTTYTPTVWQANDLITAERLNKIENRIEEIQNIKFKFTKNNLPSWNTVNQLLESGIFPYIYMEEYDFWAEVFMTDNLPESNSYYYTDETGTQYYSTSPNIPPEEGETPK